MAVPMEAVLVEHHKQIGVMHILLPQTELPDMVEAAAERRKELLTMALPAALASSSFGFHPQHNRHKRRSVSGRFLCPEMEVTYGNCRKLFTVFVW